MNEALNEYNRKQFEVFNNHLLSTDSVVLITIGINQQDEPMFLCTMDYSIEKSIELLRYLADDLEKQISKPINNLTLIK